MVAYNMLFILSWLVCSVTTIAQTNYQKLTEEELRSAPLKTVRSLANTMLTAQRQGQPYLLQESEAIPAVREEFSAEKQLQTYGAIRELFGDYQSLTFVEAYQTLTEPTYRIFRFQGKFERDNAQPEVRLVIDKDEKLAGFSIVPWQDTL